MASRQSQRRSKAVFAATRLNNEEMHYHGRINKHASRHDG